MKVKDIFACVCVTILILMGGKIVLDKYDKEENERKDDEYIYTMEISDYRSEYMPYLDVEEEKDNIKTEYVTTINNAEYVGKIDKAYYSYGIDEICVNYLCEDGTSFDVDLSKDKVIAVYFQHKKDENIESIEDEQK